MSRAASVWALVRIQRHSGGDDGNDDELEQQFPDYKAVFMPGLSDYLHVCPHTLFFKASLKP